jgi:two-component system sensor histidine kinase QseC
LLFYVIRKSLSSLVHLSQQLTYKNSDDLSQVTIAQPPKELEPVVQRLNSLLKRLSLAFERERTLSANTAHELRTPVSVLRLTAHNLRAAFGQDKLQESQFDELDANVMRMAHVIEQIIALYRYSPEHFSEQMREVSLDHLLREVIAENYEHIENAQQDISLEAIDAIVMAEPFALKILFENLLKNAMKYSGQASKIELSMQANENYVDVLVENSGEIDTAEISRLTETFYRAKNANQSGVKGSGLGLSIVQYICHIHDGELQLTKSRLGGLAVKIRLKRLTSQAEAEGE